MHRQRHFWRRGSWLVLLLTAVFLLTACQGQSQAEPETGDVVTAFIGDLAASATASGQVVPGREAGLSVSTPGRVEQVLVRVGDAAEAGQPLLQLETGDLALNVAAAEQTVRLQEANLARLQAPAGAADIAAAEAAVASAQANLDDLLAGPSAADLAVYEANLDSAEASLSSAAADLAGGRDSVSEADIAAAEAALEAARLQLRNAEEVNADNPTQATHEALLQAQEAVASAEARLDELRAGPDVAAAQSSVAAADARLEGTQADYNLQAGGPTQAEIASAESQLAQAQATLANLVDGPTAEEIAVAEAEVEQARLSLADAQEALAEATITAPFAGMVTAVNVNEGELASGVVVELVDDSSLEVVLDVDEADIGELEVGQPATITLETWPETELAGEVTFIATDATTTPGSALVSYEVRLHLDETDLPVRVGMTANANLITNQREDVLLVPNAAINADRDAGTFSVNLVEGDSTTAVPVTIGLRDSQYTQILEGIEAGDELLVGNNLPVQRFGNQNGGPPLGND